MNILNPVSSIMTTQLITVDPKDKIMRVKELFDQHKIHHLPVVQYKTIVGMVSKSDLLFFLKGLRHDHREEHFDNVRLKNYSVESIMTTGLAKVAPDDKINVVLEVFKENLFHALPVVDDNDELVGIVTTYDIVTELADTK